MGKSYSTNGAFAIDGEAGADVALQNKCL